jgi:Fascin domain
MNGQAQQREESAKNAFQVREEEYRAARRAGAEAVEIGRETLETVTRQGEQLHNAERVADETSYDLDKAGRVLRGMTWAGWVANMFAKELKPPSESDSTATSTEALVPSFYDHAPPSCRDAAQAVQNYHANLKVLAACETTEQTETCHLICENMYGVALTRLNKLLSAQEDLDPTAQSFCQTLKQDLTNLRSRQQIKKRMHSRQQKEADQYQKSRETLELPNDNSPKDYSSKPMEALVANDPDARQMLQMQDQHLDDMAQHLDDLGNLALNLGEATERQAALVDILDTKADVILDKSQMVTRRTDRLIQQKAWTPAKPTFQACVSIQHVTTQKYLAVTNNGNLVLKSKMDYESCYFEAWKRQGSIFGLQSRFNRKWVGQNMLGNLECRATSFGKRQEFEVCIVHDCEIRIHPRSTTLGLNLLNCRYNINENVGGKAMERDSIVVCVSGLGCW